MAATQDDIRKWLTQGKRDGSTHILIVCDTFDMVDFPLSVQDATKISQLIKEVDGVNMQKVMEVYNLALPLEPQLNEQRAWNV